jgi:hypothetical protein
MNDVVSSATFVQFIQCSRVNISSYLFMESDVVARASCSINLHYRFVCSELKHIKSLVLLASSCNFIGHSVRLFETGAGSAMEILHPGIIQQQRTESLKLLECDIWVFINCWHLQLSTSLLARTFQLPTLLFWLTHDIDWKIHKPIYGTLSAFCHLLLPTYNGLRDWS